MALIAHAQAVARRKVSGAAFSVVGVLFILAGLAFLCAALWILLVELRDALFAAQVIGGGLVAIGLILLGVGRIVSTRPVVVGSHSAAPQTADLPIAQLIEGFLIGLDAGRRSRK
ncbi:hypothetical protein SAMN05421759_11635 [Roseivivax lentus]|uniref:Holin-X, holin superfamily III n=1 Tax=Roseivivax lentus TaxID=633194 RepID=A0A1N7PIS0_9RHOB|nr:phage holin family protein [Roseivivax lentus]SIT10543.1 hypothetical protein SAMN05421759_11635 [Roseivivax lentus]